jgi:hypothetical protein
LGETLLWMTASPKWFKEQREEYRGAMRTEAGSHVSKARSYLKALSDAGTLPSDLQGVMQRCERLLPAADSGEDDIVSRLLSEDPEDGPSSPSKSVPHRAFDADVADAIKVVFRRLGSRQEDGEFSMKSDRLGILLTELGCYPPPTPAEVAAIAKQVNPLGGDTVTFSEFVKWYNVAF